MNESPKTKQVENFHILNNDGKPLCSHEDTSIVRSCCTIAHRGSSGFIECGCNGIDSIVCDSPNCTGLTDEEEEKIINECWD